MEPEMTPDEERARTRELMTQMGRHVAMAAFVLPEPATPAGVVNNGTASFLELPGGKFILANYHVWDEFARPRRVIPGLRLAVTGEGFTRPVDISTAELIDSDEGMDLAVLRFAANDVIESVGKRFYVPKRWPLDAARVGDDVVALGFPGSRKDPTPGYLHFESVMANWKVVSVSEGNYMFAFTNPNPIIHQFSSRSLDQIAWGGMSGSMVYRLDPDTNQFHVTGLLHAAGEGLQGSFFAGRVDCLTADGKIKRN